MPTLRVQLMGELDLPAFEAALPRQPDSMDLQTLLKNFRRQNTMGFMAVKVSHWVPQHVTKVGFALYRVRGGHADVLQFAIAPKHRSDDRIAPILISYLLALVSDDNQTVRSVRTVIPETDLWRLAVFRQAGFYGHLEKERFGDIDGVLMRYPSLQLEEYHGLSTA